MMAKLRMGIIGYGNMGSSHVKDLKEGKVKDMKVTAVCDFFPGKKRSRDSSVS